MAEDRMLSDEILLGLIKANSGGGGGTSDYEDLSNKPQIGGTTLTGNKSASDLGLVAAVEGKGLSTNDYTDADKAIVGGVTAALSGKQNVLTAGGYIRINDSNEISVKRLVLDGDVYKYDVYTNLYQTGAIVDKYDVTDQLISTRTYSREDLSTAVNIDDAFNFQYSGSNYSMTFLIASTESPVGTIVSWAFNNMEHHINSFELPPEETANDLIIRSELDEKQDTLTFDDVPTNGSNNPVKSDGIYDALTTKADLIDLAPAFSAETAYAVGKYVSYEGNIYKCTSAHSAGAWVAGDFTLVTVGSELESKQNTLTFDDAPTDGSNNPVKSNGIYDALATKANTDMVAADFNAGTSYTAGNYCIYEGKFYKFKNNHSGAWAAADVDEIKIAGELSSLKSGLINVNTALDVPAGTGKNLAFKMISKATINESGVIETNNAYNLFVAKVSNGETYTATKGNDYRVYAFFTSVPAVGSTSYDGSRVVESDSSNTFTFTAPTDGYIAFRSLVAFTDGQLEKGSTATAYTPYIPSVDTRLEAVENGKANAATYNMVGGQTVKITHVGIVAIMSDRGGLYIDGISNRGINDLVPSTQITVTHVDATHVTVTNNSQYGTSILVLSDGDITVMPVQ